MTSPAVPPSGGFSRPCPICGRPMPIAQVGGVCNLCAAQSRSQFPIGAPGGQIAPPSGMGYAPMGGPGMAAPPMGGPPMARPGLAAGPMGAPPMGAPPMGAPPMGAPPMGAPPMAGPNNRFGPAVVNPPSSWRGPPPIPPTGGGAGASSVNVPGLGPTGPSSPRGVAPAAAGPSGPRSGPAGGSSGARPRAASGPRSSGPAAGEGAGDLPPGYELLSELGRGGNGVVYKARDTRLGRVVALKMLLAGVHSSATDLERFRLEAESVARVQHPNIVQIFEVGSHRGLPFFCLEFCEGGPLSSKLAGRPMPPRPAASNAEAVARALEAAHRTEIIHRDLKPANILLTADGTPKLTDFGLAKRLDSVGRTATGSLMGTPAYMSPEQADGSKSIGPAADVYGLGAVLYEMLTGRPPFLGESEINTIWMVMSQEPVPVRQLSSRVPRDLETICHKCLAKDPARRYRSAGELAEDLQRFLSGQPILARPAGPVERAFRFAQNNPTVTILSAISVLALVALGVGGLAVSARMAANNRELQSNYAKLEEQQTALAKERDSAKQARQEAEVNATLATQRRDEVERALQNTAAQTRLAQQRQVEAEQQRQRAESSLDSARRNRYLANARLAAQAFQEGRLQQLEDLLEDMRPRPGEPDLRGFEWAYLLQQLPRPLAEYTGQVGWVITVAYSPDGSLIAAGGTERVVRLLNAATGELVGQLPGHRNQIHHVAFSPDGRRLATVGSGEPVLVWDLATRQVVRRLAVHGNWIGGVCWTPDGKFLLSVGHDKQVRIWDVEQSREVAAPDAFGVIGMGAALARDGRFAAVIGVDFPSPTADVRLFEPTTGKPLGKLPGHQVGARAVAVAPNSKYLASAGADGMVRFWDMTAAPPREIGSVRGHAGVVMWVCFSPDSRFAATAGMDGQVRLWDPATAKVIDTVASHKRQLFACEFSPNGQQLATACIDGQVRLWPIRAAGARNDLFDTGRMIVASAISPDSQRFAVAGGIGGSIEFRSLATGESVGRADGHLLFTTGLAWSPDGSRLASAGPLDADIKIWDAQTGTKVGGFGQMNTGAVSVAWSRDATRLAIGGAAHQLKVFEVATGRELLVHKPHRSSIQRVVFSADGRMLATGSFDSHSTYWRPDTLAQIVEYRRDGILPMMDLAFSTDSKTVFTSSADGAVHLIDAEKFQDIGELRGGDLPVALAVSPDGQILAVGGIDGTVRLWDLPTRQPRAIFNGHDSAVMTLSFSPDGRYLISGSLDKKVRIWRTVRDADLVSQALQRATTAAAGPAQFESVRTLALAAWGRHWELRRSGQPRLAADALRPALEWMDRLAERGPLDAELSGWRDQLVTTIRQLETMPVAPAKSGG